MKISNFLAILGLLVPGVVNAGELMKNWGLFNQHHSSHIDAPKAWKLAKGGRRVAVCVIDTGVDITHPELKGRICPSVNGDEYGWDFVTNTKNPTDFNGHGTHVAGIIRATAPTACIIPVKWYSDRSTLAERLKATTDAIGYCAKRGARIINYSGGGEFSDNERLAIEIAGRKGILFVAAAGNEYMRLGGSVGYYPASYNLPNILAVASLTFDNQLVPSSDYGSMVQVAAPGENIYSTIPGGRYANLTGTSMATPFVSGIAAMLLSKYSLSVKQLKDVIIGSVDKKPALRGKVSSGGKVNAYRAMVKAKEFVVRKPTSKIR